MRDQGLDIRFDFAKGKKYAKLLDGATAPPAAHAPKVKRLPADRSTNDSRTPFKSFLRMATLGIRAYLLERC